VDAVGQTRHAHPENGVPKEGSSLRAIIVYQLWKILWVLLEKQSSGFLMNEFFIAKRTICLCNACCEILDKANDEVKRNKRIVKEFSELLKKL